MRYLFTCFIMVWAFMCFAQKEYHHWHFGSQGSLFFNECGKPEHKTGSILKAIEGSSSIASKTGNLLFYSNGNDVWNRKHQVLDNGTELLGESSATQGSLIVELPQSPSEYYLFTLGKQDGKRSLYFSTIDMKLDNGFGGVTDEKNVALSSLDLTEKLIAVKQANGLDYWIVTHEWNGNRFIVYPLTRNGVGRPILSSVGRIHEGEPNNAAGELVASIDGQQLVSIQSGRGFIEHFNFNTSTGRITDGLGTIDELPLSYGAEFSPNGRFLYTSQWQQNGASTSSVWQFDLESIGEIEKHEIGRSTAALVGSLTMGPNGDIFLAKNDQPYLGRIQNTNLPYDPLNPSFIDNGYLLSSSRSTLGLPNIIKSIESIDLPIVQLSFPTVCTGQATILNFEIDVPKDDIEDIEWQVKDTLGNLVLLLGSKDSTLTIQSPGHYEIIASITTKCGTYSGNQLLHVIQTPIVRLPKDTIGLCGSNGDSVIIRPNWAMLSGFENSWDDGSTDSFKIVRTSEYLAFNATNDSGCTGTAYTQVGFFELHGLETIYRKCDSATIVLDDSIHNPERYGGQFGVEPYIYNWSPLEEAEQIGNSQFVINNTEERTYYVTAIDDSGCVVTDSINVQVSTEHPVLYAGEDQTVCKNQQVTIGLDKEVTGGTPDYKWRWRYENNKILFHGWYYFFDVDSSTTLTLQVIDSFNCESFDTIEIFMLEDLPPIVELGTEIIVCDTGVYMLGANAVRGGTPPLTYKWFPENLITDPNVAEAEVHVAGTQQFTLEVTDANDCVVVDDQFVFVGDQADSALIYDLPDKICGNSPVIEIRGTPTEGIFSGPGIVSSETRVYTHSSVLPSQNIPDNSITGLTSQINLFSENLVPIGEGLELESICIDIQHEKLGDLVIELFAPNGQRYTLLDRMTNNSGISCSGTVDSFCLIMDPFATTIQTQCNGFIKGNYGEGAANALTAINKSAINPNGTWLLKISDRRPEMVGKFYNWSLNFKETVGLFDVSKIDSLASVEINYAYSTQFAKCGANIAQSIEILPFPTASAAKGAVVFTCQDDSIQLGGQPAGIGGTGSLQYKWQPVAGLSDAYISNPLAAPTAPEYYTLIVIDSNNCTDKAIVELTFALADAGGPEVVLCGTDSVLIGGIPTARGGFGQYDYSWQPNEGISNPAIANPKVKVTSDKTYTLTITDSIGCTSIDTVRFIPKTKPSIIWPDTLFACHGSIKNLAENLTIQDGEKPYSYQWHPISDTSSSPFVMVDSSFQIRLSIRDSFGCRSTDSAFLAASFPPNLEPGNDKIVCWNDTLYLGGEPTATGGAGNYLYAWNSLSTLNISDTSAANPFLIFPEIKTDATVYVTVTDKAGCVAIDSLRITPSYLTIKINNDSIQLHCFGDSLKINASIQPNSSGHTLEWITPEPVRINDQKQLTCYPTVDGQYELIATTEYGCEARDHIFVDVSILQPEVDAGESGVFCEKSQLELGGKPTAKGGVEPYRYAWRPFNNLNNAVLANPVLTVRNDLTYTITVTDKYNCRSVDSVDIAVIANTVEVLIAPEIEGCQGVGLDIGNSLSAIGGTPEYSYAWNPAAVFNDNTLPNPTAKPRFEKEFVSVRVTDANGCSQVGYITMLGLPGPAVSITTTDDLEICVGQHVAVDAVIDQTNGVDGPFIYEWSPAEYSSNPDEKTTEIQLNAFDGSRFEVKVFNNLGCFGVASIFLENHCENSTHVPSSFTPNADGLNDVFEIFSPTSKNYQLRIYNRWGKTVYRGDKNTTFWDGNKNGVEQPVGAYYYVLEVEYYDGSVVTMHNSIMLIK